MGSLLKKFVYVILGLVGLFVVVAIAITLLFDPNDYRERIAMAVKEETGRDLAIEGDLDLSFFPWFAINIGKTTLGNAAGFGDTPFLRFDEARASLKVMPLISGEGLVLGDVVLDGFELNLAVARDGRNNWQDIVEAGERDDKSQTSDTDADAGQGSDMSFVMSGVKISDAAVRYDDAQAGESYKLTEFNLATGPLGGSGPLDLESDFNFEIQPADVSGDFRIELALGQSEQGGATLAGAEISAMGVDATLEVDNDADGVRLEVDAFSLKSLMQRLNIEPPVTADPNVLDKIILDADVRMSDTAITASNLELVVDDTIFKGDMSIARNARGTISVNLAGNEIDLDRYMEPAAEAGGGGSDAVPVEIPVELIRALNVRGKLTLESASLSGLAFENVRLGLNTVDGNMRLHPISADLFGGKYEGDVRINAAGNTPSISVNENVSDVNLGSLAAAMFEQQNVTGTINGSFQLAGRGADLAAIQHSLNGTISMQLDDGAYEGTDLWYELRRARALYKKEAPPEPQLPARTEFSNVRASGPVVDGVFQNKDLFAELPYMQITGNGKVDFAAGKVDYRMTARVLERPEFVAGATEEELKEFTEAEIPLRVTGSLVDPSIKPDVEEMLKKEVRKKVEEEIKDRLLDKLFGD